MKDHCVSDRIDVNHYWIDEHWGKGSKWANFLNELYRACNHCEEYQNHDRSDSMTDYFDVGWWVDINLGKYGKPYQVNAN